jgi:hypothetical protein
MAPTTTIFALDHNFCIFQLIFKTEHVFEAQFLSYPFSLVCYFQNGGNIQDGVVVLKFCSLLYNFCSFVNSAVNTFWKSLNMMYENSLVGRFKMAANPRW